MLKKITLYLSSIIIAFSIVGSAYAVTLKASHQWPGTPRADGSYDPRHEMVQIIADEVKKVATLQENLALVEKMNEIPKLTLKSIVTNNSLYL